MVDLDELKSEFLNTEFASRDLQIEADNLVTAATASGEGRAEFVGSYPRGFSGHTCLSVQYLVWPPPTHRLPILGGYSHGRRQGGRTLCAGTRRSAADGKSPFARHL
jgi:hypothetical protein